MGPKKSTTNQNTGPILANSAWYNVIRYKVAPPLFLLIFTGAVQILALLGRKQAPCPLDLQQCHRVIGNQFSWIFVICFTLWAMTSLWIPAKEFLGPPSLIGYRPRYAANGMTFYFISLALFSILQAAYPTFSLKIYDNIPEILGSYNTIAMALCTWLLYKGRRNQKNSELKPLLYDFYRGTEHHPRFLDCDVKQLTICRIGMMIWQVLILAFFIAEYQKTGFNSGSFVTLTLQTIYLMKFFYWETGYFNTLDITYDRAGYYLCWGCLVWVPALYTLHSYHMVDNPSEMTQNSALITFIIGIFFIIINYRVDYEKEVFCEWYQRYLKNKSKAGKCYLWGKPVTYVETKYKNSQGEEKRSALLTSGFWGLARHDNYTFELLCALCWCLPASIGHGAFPLLYFFFLVFLLVHRVYRDEDKCSAKYGPYWDIYCKEVPYRMLPYVY